MFLITGNATMTSVHDYAMAFHWRLKASSFFPRTADIQVLSSPLSLPTCLLLFKSLLSCGQGENHLRMHTNRIVKSSEKSCNFASDRLTYYIKASQPFLKIFKTNNNIPDRPGIFKEDISKLY